MHGSNRRRKIFERINILNQVKRAQLALLLICLVLPSVLWAKDYPAFGPVTTRSQNPFYLQTINLTPTNTRVFPRGTLSMRVDSAYSNIFESGSSSTYELMADMELWRLALHSDYSLRDDLEIGVEIPFIQTWGGFLDSFIQGFHNFFGFPNAGRERVGNNQFSFYLKDAAGQPVYSKESQNMDLGDISVHIKHHILDEKKFNPALAWFFDFKFPSGNESKGLSSGGTDFGLGLALEKSYKRVHGYLNAGYYVSGRSDVLQTYSEDVFFSYMAALEVTLLPTWSVMAQINGGTPLYKNTGIDSWDGVPLDLIVGFKGEEEKVFDDMNLLWQFGFSEDVTSAGPSIDFSIFLSIGFRFNVKS